MSQDQLSSNFLRRLRGKFRHFNQSPLPLDFKIPFKKICNSNPRDKRQCSEGGGAQHGSKRALVQSKYRLQLSSHSVCHLMWLQTPKHPVIQGVRSHNQGIVSNSLDPTARAQSANCVQRICSCSRSTSGVMKKSTKDMQPPLA